MPLRKGATTFSTSSSSYMCRLDLNMSRRTSRLLMRTLSRLSDRKCFSIRSCKPRIQPAKAEYERGCPCFYSMVDMLHLALPGRVPAPCSRSVDRRIPPAFARNKDRWRRTASSCCPGRDSPHTGPPSWGAKKQEHTLFNDLRRKTTNRAKSLSGLIDFIKSFFLYNFWRGMGCPLCRRVGGHTLPLS